MEENKLINEEQEAEEVIKQRIFIIRNRRVMLDADLARLYGVNTKVFNQAVKRNLVRFPEDFLFQISNSELESLNRSQSVTGSQKHRDPRFPPYAFTEYGIAMLSSVLNSERAIQMNIFIIRAFIRMRELTISNNELSLEIEIIKSKQNNQAKIIANIQSVVTQMIERPIKKKGKLGFNENRQD
jgi:hypothetical protein